MDDDAPKARPAGADEIVRMDAVGLSDAIAARTVSCVEVMGAFLDRIERVNPQINAIVSLRDRGELLAEARTRDDELGRGIRRGWMHGFPQAVKDLTATAGIRTTQGSPLFADTVPERDAIMVERLKAAGAIVIGKTNTPEFGLGSHTYNPLFGATRNPYDPNKSAGGSSGGAAAALATRMLPVADGSDHGGSLRNPAAFNNVFGLRTSYGRVPGPTDEVFLPALGVAGPMARTVPDLARLLSIQAGYDARTPHAIRQDPAIFAAPLARDVAGRRIAWFGDFDGYLPMEAGILDLCESALSKLEELGCRVEAAQPDYPPAEIWRNWLTLRRWQVGAKLAPLYADPAKRAQMKPAARWEVENGLGLSALDVHEASIARTAWYDSLRRLFETYDYVALPSAQVFPFDIDLDWPHEIAGRAMDTYHRWMEVVIAGTMSGCPTIGMPVGFGPAGLPMGMQLIGRNHDELSLLEVAHAYDEATGWVRSHPPPAAHRAHEPAWPGA